MNPILKYVSSDESKVFGFFEAFEFLALNFPCGVKYKGREFPSAANAFYSARCSTEEDIATLQEADPYQTRDMARNLPIPSNWMDVRGTVMKEVLESKFSDEDLKEKLIKTKSKSLINANHWGDDFWGVKETGTGSNKLGLLLEEIRNSFPKAVESTSSGGSAEKSGFLKFDKKAKVK